jgi:hypothetical protein
MECEGCAKRQGIYEDGSRFIVRPSLCAICKGEVKTESVKKESDIVETRNICLSCGHEEIETDDYQELSARLEKERLEDQELLKEYREEFCFNEKDGNEAVELIEKLKFAKDVREAEKRKFYDPAFEELSKLKKMTISEIEKSINEKFESSNYSHISFDKPENGQFFIIPFALQDNDSKRRKEDSEKQVISLINEALMQTNWRLITNSVSYRLGYITGSLRGYESEKEFLDLLGRKNDTKQVLDPVLEAKYGSDDIIQLAKSFGEYDGKEAMRRKRLEKEPNGFLLANEGRRYQCQICQHYYDDNEMWWDGNGIRCLDCQRNLNEGVIPYEVCTNERSWIKEWHITENYKVHPATRRKLVRQGVLKSRELRRVNGDTYCSIYLVKENKPFFKLYPKVKNKNSNLIIIESDGQEIQL